MPSISAGKIKCEVGDCFPLAALVALNDRFHDFENKRGCLLN